MVVDHFLHDLGEVGVEGDGGVAVNAGDEVGAAAEVNAVFFAPFDPAVVGIDGFHEGLSFTASCADCVVAE